MVSFQGDGVTGSMFVKKWLSFSLKQVDTVGRNVVNVFCTFKNISKLS